MPTDNQGDLLHGKRAASAKAPDASDSKSKLLYVLLCLLFAGLILTDLGVFGAFYWQTRQVRRRLDQFRQAITKHQHVEQPIIDDVTSKLEAYAIQNKDFQPIAQRYAPLFPRLQPQPPAAPTKAPATAPAAPSAKASK
ncbi:MAG: hypothetical protein HZA90_07695 [Verrucomicrobia bacterium]|nr:hypothetical protein [Verrucomicrobiota bacterium]